MTTLIETEPPLPLPKRGISQATCEKFGYFKSRDNQGRAVQVAPYHDDTGRLVAQKVRTANKDMFVVGKMPTTFFGQKLWKPSTNKKLVVTEGEIDALSIYEVMGDWPVVSIPTGAQGAARSVAANLTWIEGFDEVILCFDMDEPGKAAASEVAQILRPGLASIMSLPLKDANEMLVAGRQKELREAFWNANHYAPDGLVDAIDLWDTVASPQPPSFAAYPWDSVNEFLQGMRKQEIVVWTAGTGVGKSTATREIIHSALGEGHRVGVIALEESVRDTVRYQMGLELNHQLHLPSTRVDHDDLRRAFDSVAPNLVVHDHWGSLEIERLVNVVRYMAVGRECQLVVLDHITMVVSGLQSNDERKDLDVLMTKLRTLAQDLDICIQVVSHIKRTGEDRQQIRKTDLRGSAALEQLADQIVALERDDQDPENSNLTRVRVLKNRPAGWLTGTAGYLRFEPDTGRLVETTGPEISQQDVGF